MKGTILVVDKESGPREALRLILADEHSVFVASNGAEALEILVEETVDAVTLDLLLPDFEGFDLVKAIKKLRGKTEIIVVTGKLSIDLALELMKQGVSDIVAKPFHPIEIKSVVDRALSKTRSEKTGSAGAFFPFPELSGTLEIVEATTVLRTFHIDADKTEIGALDALIIFSKAIEASNEYTQGHSERVWGYLKAVSAFFSMKPIEKEELEIAALLHDIGKFSLPYHRIYKNAPLSMDDWIIVHQHPQKGAELIHSLHLSKKIENAITHHHERFDGTGYPTRLKGSEIPLLARLLSLADAIDAMKNRRIHRRSLGTQKILSELKSHAGKQFDPELTEIFLECLPLSGNDFEQSSAGRTA